MFSKIKAFYEVKRVRNTPRDTGSMSMNTSYHKEHEYIWLRGGDLKGF